MPINRKELNPEDMLKLWRLYKSGESLVGIANRFNISTAQATRLAQEAATTIGAGEALAKLSGEPDAATT